MMIQNNNQYELNYSEYDQAFKLLENSSCVVTAMAASEPQIFYTHAAKFLSSKKDLRIYCSNPSKSYEIFEHEDLLGHVELRPMFLTSSIRYHQSKSHIHYVPQHLSMWTNNILLNEPNIDVFWGSCSIPDSRGFVSLGPSVCYEFELLRKSKRIILEVNPNIPFTHGSTCIPSKSVDLFIHSNQPLPIYPSCQADETDHKIAEHIADLIEDGSTIQLGIGSIPNALGSIIKNKKDLGIHTEMINDTILDLYEYGSITGKNKTIWQDKIIGTFAYGSQRLYEFLHQNPMVELHPASVVNDPYRIGRNHKMVSINTAVEIDITGQVCSESIGHLELSGIGGASETHIGAQKSKDGRGIIAMRSVTKKDDSKIVSELKPGSKVSISRNDIDTVITEYGTARLKGKTVAQRAKELIAIAHPKYREELHTNALKNGYL